MPAGLQSRSAGAALIGSIQDLSVRLLIGPQCMLLRLAVAASTLGVALVLRHRQQTRQGDRPASLLCSSMCACTQALLLAERRTRRPLRAVRLVPSAHRPAVPTFILSGLLWLLVLAFAAFTAYQAHHGMACSQLVHHSARYLVGLLTVVRVQATGARPRRPLQLSLLQGWSLASSPSGTHLTRHVALRVSLARCMCRCSQLLLQAGTDRNLFRVDAPIKEVEQANLLLQRMEGSWAKVPAKLLPAASWVLWSSWLTGRCWPAGQAQV